MCILVDWYVDNSGLPDPFGGMTVSILKHGLRYFSFGTIRVILHISGSLPTPSLSILFLHDCLYYRQSRFPMILHMDQLGKLRTIAPVRGVTACELYEDCVEEIVTTSSR